MAKETKTLKLDDEILSLPRKSLNDRLLGMRDEGVERIGIDLSEKPYLNSEAIGMLAYNYVVLHDFGTELFLLNPSARVLKTLESTGLNRVIKIENA